MYVLNIKVLRINVYVLSLDSEVQDVTALETVFQRNIQINSNIFVY